MSMLYLAGKDANILRRATVTCAPAASSVAPLANLYDDAPGTPFIFGSNAGNSYVLADINILDNPSFDAGITSWSTSGTVAYTTTAGEWRTASGGMKITNGYAYQLKTVPAGESRKFSVWAKVLSGIGSADIRIQNKTTGNWWNGTAWQATQTTCATSALGSFAELTTTYTVESFDVVGADHCTLLIGVFSWSAALVTVFDDAYDVPGVSFVSIHGHNIRGGWTASPTTAQVISWSDDAFSTSTDVTYFEQYRGAFYETFAVSYHRWWRVLWYGTNYETMYLGEMVLGQYKTAAFGPEWGMAVDHEIPGVRNVTSLGGASVKNFSFDATQSLRLPCNPSTAAGARELLDSIWLRSGQGRYPTIIVPSDSETAVYYGRLLKPVSQSRIPGLYPMSFELQGSPLPTVGA